MGAVSLCPSLSRSRYSVLAMGSSCPRYGIPSSCHGAHFCPPFITGKLLLGRLAVGLLWGILGRNGLMIHEILDQSTTDDQEGQHQDRGEQEDGCFPCQDIFPLVSPLYLSLRSASSMVSTLDTTIGRALPHKSGDRD